MKKFALVIAIFGLILSISTFLGKNYKYEHYALETKSTQIKTYKVNLNLANWREFDNLPGIGPSLAHKIIADRDTNGRFDSVEDIKRVKGIGEKKFAEIQKYLTLEVQ